MMYNISTKKEVNKMTKKEAYDKLTNMVPYAEADYFNSVFATKISKGKEITDDEIRITLMNGVEDDFITWGSISGTSEDIQNSLECSLKRGIK